MLLNKILEMEFWKIIQKQFAIIILIFLSVSIFAQPLPPPNPFEDHYLGGQDDAMLDARVKVHRTYYKTSYQNEKSFYNSKEYNKEGRLVSQKWYDYISQELLYTATYDYYSDGQIRTSTELITDAFDAAQIFATQSSGLAENILQAPLNEGQPIPQNPQKQYVVKTDYNIDTFKQLIAKKYFFDGAFYKMQRCVYRPDDIHHSIGIYLDSMFTPSFYCDNAYLTDTTRSNDSIIVTVKYQYNPVDSVVVIYAKEQANMPTMLNSILVSDRMKIYPSYNYEHESENPSEYKARIRSITYISQLNKTSSLFLEHKFLIGSTSLRRKVWLPQMDVGNFERIRNMGGAVFHTTFEEGYLKKEEEFSPGYPLKEGTITKMREIYYGSNNLISKIIIYPPHYADCYGPFSSSFQTSEFGKHTEEIHEYEYFK
jgi:hypothetical protein